MKIRFNSSFLNYKPKINIQIKSKNYELKTADTLRELVEAFELRQNVFFNDSNGIDFDQFDSDCDHMIIKNLSTQEVVGTYRIRNSFHHSHFYSQEEFNISEFLDTDGVKIELGRASTHVEHRNGIVLDLLWKGIGMYCNKLNSRYLFGCSSINYSNHYQAFGVLNSIRENNYYSENYNITTNVNYQMKEPKLQCFSNNYFAQVSPLLKSYLHAGAMIHGGPAHDKDFDCIDFLTILDLDKINPHYKRRYFIN